MEPGEGALDDPADTAEPGAVLALATGDLRCDAAGAEFASARLRDDNGKPDDMTIRKVISP